MSATRAADVDRRSGWIPYTFFAMFGVIIAVNGTMIYFALSTAPGVEDGAYERGVNYNDLLAERREQAALGWLVELRQGAFADNRSDLEVAVHGRDGAALPNARVLVQFRRPAQAAMDFTVELTDAGGGTFRETVDWPATGIWDAELTVVSGGRVHNSEQRLYIR